MSKTGSLGYLLCLAFFMCSLVRAEIPAGYYDAVDTSNETTLRTTLHETIDDHTRYPYTATGTDTWDILEPAQEDPNDSGKILDIYRNESYPKYTAGNDDYDREHVWPKSYGFPSESTYPYTDCHHLMLANGDYNSSRSNKPFGTCTASDTEKETAYNAANGIGGGSGTYPGYSNWADADHWEVWTGRRGDVARALFYMDVRYEGGTHGITGATEPDLRLTDDEALIAASDTGSNESVAYMGLLSVLLEWNQEDPVDDLERSRNDVVYSYQGNRNPFIDHPEWVSVIFGGADTTAPAVPTGLTAATNASVQVVLDWNDNSETDFEQYYIYRATADGGPYAQLSTTTVTLSTFTDTSVSAGITYYYVITALDTTGNESNTSTQAGVIAGDVTAPAVPSGLTATRGDGQVTLDWNDNGEADLAGYRLLRATVDGGPYTAVSGTLLTSSQYSDLAVVNDTPYYYVVQAIDFNSNASANSTQVQATPTDLTPPAAPANLSAVGLATQVTLEWDDNGEADLAGYYVYRSQTSGGPYDPLNVTLETSSAYVDTTVTSGTTYYYVVTAVDTHDNESGQSAPAEATASGTDTASGTPWINEIHYDNDGTDVNEFIEIAGPAGLDLSGWTLVAYNGGTGMVYHSQPLSGVIPNESACRGALTFTYAANGLQNGPPDGIALADDEGNLVQFLSYEGTFTGVGGPADGMTSEDIGVSETSTTPVGYSLQLGGTGNSYDDFAWQSALAGTPGSVNTNQTFEGGCPPETPVSLGLLTLD